KDLGHSTVISQNEARSPGGGFSGTVYCISFLPFHQRFSCAVGLYRSCPRLAARRDGTIGNRWNGLNGPKRWNSWNDWNGLPFKIDRSYLYNLLSLINGLRWSDP